LKLVDIDATREKKPARARLPVVPQKRAKENPASAAEGPQMRNLPRLRN